MNQTAHPGFRRSRGLRGDINLVLNRLVGQGVIASYRTNFDTVEAHQGPHVTVTAPPSRAPDDVRLRVMDALAAVAVGVGLTVELE
jgi:hypothetical protein